MKKHTRIYLKAMGYDIGEFILCEWCQRSEAVDCHHIEPRGMGSSKLKDTPENIIGLCRYCHLDAEAKRISKEELSERHLTNLKCR